MNEFIDDSQDDEEDGSSGPLRFYVPPEQEVGAYAETVAVWHTPYDFIIDFATIQLAQLTDPNDPNSELIVPARVVSRVRIPPGLVFDLIRTINARMEAYEAEWGEIKAPEPRPTGGDSE